MQRLYSKKMGKEEGETSKHPQGSKHRQMFIECHEYLGKHVRTLGTSSLDMVTGLNDQEYQGVFSQCEGCSIHYHPSPGQTSHTDGLSVPHQVLA